MINIFDISTLVTDRTRADVQAWNDKGTYNPSDLNRVTHAMEYLVERIRSYGYTVKYEKVKVPHQPQKGKNRLPAGYIELEYIESTGTQYIDTGFKPNQDTRVVADMQMVGTPVNAFFFGGRTSTSSNIFCFLWLESNKVFRTDYNNKQKSVSGVYNDRVFVDFNKNIVEMNGTIIEHTYGTFQSTGNLFIFAASTSGTMSSPASARLYSFKLYDNGALVRDFIPCKNPDGVVGLYDFVNKKFYGNSGSGNFIAGGELIPRKLPEGYTQVTYIQSSGTQYFNTGYKPNNNTRVVVDFENTGDYSGMTTSLCPFFGSRNDSSSAVFALWIGTKTFPQYGNVAYNKNGNFTVNLNTRLIYDFDKNVVTIGDNTITCATASFTTNYELHLLAVNNFGTIDSRHPSGKLYSCKMYDNDTITRDYVPCVNSNGTAGLYDLVNGAFYSNAGTGVFETGSIIEQPSAEEPYDDYTWYISDIPQAKELGMYLQNARNLRNTLALFSNTPYVPDDMERFTFEEANNIETILVNIEAVINLMIQSWIYSGEIFSGEVI